MSVPPAGVGRVIPVQPLRVFGKRFMFVMRYLSQITGADGNEKHGASNIIRPYYSICSIT